MREIARLAGVSPATVSRYLTGAEAVSGQKAERIAGVLATLDEGELPRVRGSNRVVGVVVPNLRLQFFTDVLWEIMQQIGGYGFQAVFIPATGNDRFTYLDTIRSLNLAGLILLDEEIPADLMKVIRQTGCKVVICGGANFSYGHSVTCVHINDLSAGYEGTRYLIGKGHRNIAFLADFPHSISSGFQRLAGAKKALEEAGVPFHERLMRYGDMIDSTGYRLTEEILGENLPFTAIFAFSDQMAVGAMNALKDRGKSVPEDVSLLGFDDLLIAQGTRPRLTTIHQPLKKIVSSTLDIFAANVISMDNTEINIPFTIVERESCRDLTPPPEGAPL